MMSVGLALHIVLILFSLSGADQFEPQAPYSGSSSLRFFGRPSSWPSPPSSSRWRFADWSSPLASRLDELNDAAVDTEDLQEFPNEDLDAAFTAPLMYLGYAYAGLVILGGLMGFVKAKSKASLIAGTICGVAIGVATYLKTTLGLAALSFFFTFFFGIKLVKTKKAMPGGIFTALSIVTFGVAVLSLHKAGTI